MKKNHKKPINWFLVASIGYYISAIILFITKDNETMAITNLCLGSCFFCLAVSNSEKDNKDNEDSKDNHTNSDSRK